jgi:hypothetical protein
LLLTGGIDWDTLCRAVNPVKNKYIGKVVGITAYEVGCPADEGDIATIRRNVKPGLIPMRRAHLIVLGLCAA